MAIRTEQIDVSFNLKLQKDLQEHEIICSYCENNMIKSFKVRLEPNNKQNSLLFGCAGTGRWAYNFALAKIQEHYKETGKFLKDGEIRKQITQLKKTDEFKWLNKYSASTISQHVKDADNAYKKFFKGLSNFPKFKSKKKSKPSFYSRYDRISFTLTHVQLEKIGKIKLSEYNRIPIGKTIKYMNPRVTFDGLNWYLSIAVELENNINPILINEKLGIDVGVKDLAIVSNGNVYKNINKSKTIKKLEKKLKRLQRKVSKKYLMNKQDKKFIKTNNIKKLEFEIQKVYKRLSNIRTDYIQKVSTEIVKFKPSRIVMETLNIKDMMKNRHLSKAIQQQKLYEFKILLKYKSIRDGIEFIEADRWYPSSKTCSECGYKKLKLSLGEREFICESCGCIIDRDLNAAVNLSQYEIA